MVQLMKDKTREIIDDFAKEIEERKIEGAPRYGVIDFRGEKSKGKERRIYDVPLELLRYRKDSGRIASDVISYEKTHLIPLDETKQETQMVLFEFLKNKVTDSEKTELLKKSIRKDGQTEPAIITCDGFLINGNRRRMVLELLRQEKSSKYTRMKVIILPGKNDEGGPPTIKEVELLENRYQLQETGKSEYTGLDRALSITRKIACGIPLEEQLQDDPACSGMAPNSKAFRKAVKDYQDRFLLPLARADAYLEIIGRPGYYESIKERWQAFIDFSNFYSRNLGSKPWQARAGIKDDDIGTIQAICFDIIRKRSIKGRSSKLHEIIRKMPKLLGNAEARRSLFEIPDAIEDLSDSERHDGGGNEVPFDEQDRIWGAKNEAVFARLVNNAYSHLEAQREEESALTLMRAAHKKLSHPNMKVNNISGRELKEFIKEAEKVIELANDLKCDAWDEAKRRRSEA